MAPSLQSASELAGSVQGLVRAVVSEVTFLATLLVQRCRCAQPAPLWGGEREQAKEAVARSTSSATQAIALLTARYTASVASPSLVLLLQAAKALGRELGPLVRLLAQPAAVPQPAPLPVSEARLLEATQLLSTVRDASRSVTDAAKRFVIAEVQDRALLGGQRSSTGSLVRLSQSCVALLQEIQQILILRSSASSLSSPASGDALLLTFNTKMTSARLSVFKLVQAANLAGLSQPASEIQIAAYEYFMVAQS